MCAILCSFTYVVAQIYGVGIITTRMTGVDFQVSVFLGGLAGILVCSFLGGMRAVTWTQVAQYIILIIAYLIPVVMLAYRNTGVPVPWVVYGYTLQKVTQKEQELAKDPKEQEVRGIFKKRADADARLKGLRIRTRKRRRRPRSAWPICGRRMRQPIRFAPRRTP